LGSAGEGKGVEEKEAGHKDYGFFPSRGTSSIFMFGRNRGVSLFTRSQCFLLLLRKLSV